MGHHLPDFPLPADEDARLDCLPAYDVLGTPPEAEFDQLARLAAETFDVPICLVSIIGKDEQWFKAHWGLDIDHTPRDMSFCAHTICTPEPLVALDATLDARFARNPLVIGPQNIRFYAGAPLLSQDGIHLGSFCILDRVPRSGFSDVERRLLIKFAGVVSERLEARRVARRSVAIGSFAQATGLALITADVAGKITFWNQAAEAMFGYDRDEAIGRPLDIIMPMRFRAHHRHGLARLAAGGRSTLAGKSLELIALHRTGHEFPVEISIATWEGPKGTEFGAHLQDISERRAREAKLHHLAIHDGLTGLLNRNGFCKSVAERLEADGCASLLVLDLDSFKSVNDTLGHGVGDVLLQTIALRMKACLDTGSVIGRLGGDEFAVLLSCGSDMIKAGETARALLDGFADPFVIDGHDLQVGTSIGLAIAPNHATDADELIVRADLALMHAKKSGGRTYKVFDTGMANQLAAKHAFKDEMRHAFLNRQWVLFYQPQFELATGRLIGAEALLRWKHPTRGLLMPSVFMPILETHLLAYELGCWIIDEACRQLAEWRADGVLIDHVSVNLFAVQVRSGTIIAVVDAALERHGLQPSDLELEITETIILSHDDGALEPLSRLRDSGVAIAFDDFGTGFASLSTLKRFPLSRLKIDRSFVEDICTDPHSAAIVRGVALMGQGIGLKVIAEGIETVEQATVVEALGCVEGQGYLFGSPVDGVSFALDHSGKGLATARSFGA